MGVAPAVGGCVRETCDVQERGFGVWLGSEQKTNGVWKGARYGDGGALRVVFFVLK